MTMLIRRVAAALALALCAGGAAAHTGHGTHGFFAGLGHPLAPDHLLAMLAVGVWSALALRGARRWAGPALFIGAMLTGAAFGAAGARPPFVEPAIAASVVLFGVLLIGATRLPPALGLAAVAASALLHGLAHGAELPAGASFAGYGAGFVATTALLHIGGLALGERLRQQLPRVIAPLAALLSGAGLVLLARI